MGIPILLFRLEGPLQSWGERSKWDYRDTADFPSKSGIVGLLSCALGLEREDPEIAELNRQLSVIVRADRTGELITDYHTVSTDMLLNAKGEKRSGAGTIVSHRGYLQDASFLVGVNGDRALLERLRGALDSPVWPVYLGRKSCVPSVPVTGSLKLEYGSLLEAMEEEPLSPRHDERILAESDSMEGDGRLRPDLTVGPRQFQNRRVTVHTVSVKDGEK